MAEPGSSTNYPIPISRIASRYFLYDIDAITDLRAHYRIPGTLTGTLPQSPQQNVFLGLPLQLMAEEARLLVEKGLAYIVDDVAAHKLVLSSMTVAEQNLIRRGYAKIGREKAEEVAREANEKKARALEKFEMKGEAKASSSPITLEATTHNSPTPDSTSTVSDLESSKRNEPHEDDGSASLFSPSSASTARPPRHPSPHASTITPQAYYTTPTTSLALLPSPPASPSQTIPETNPDTYALYAHLHAHDYFLSPGLRFGCPLLVYPGDPLRFHSHFLARGMGWEEEWDLMGLVGSGRLGTGVKKGYLIGGKVEEGEEGGGGAVKKGEGNVRCFCIEWAGM